MTRSFQSIAYVWVKMRLKNRRRKLLGTCKASSITMRSKMGTRTETLLIARDVCSGRQARWLQFRRRRWQLRGKYFNTSAFCHTLINTHFIWFHLFTSYEPEERKLYPIIVTSIRHWKALLFTHFRRTFVLYFVIWLKWRLLVWREVE